MNHGPIGTGIAYRAMRFEETVNSKRHARKGKESSYTIASYFCRFLKAHKGLWYMPDTAIKTVLLQPAS